MYEYPRHNYFLIDHFRKHGILFRRQVEEYMNLMDIKQAIYRVSYHYGKYVVIKTNNKYDLTLQVLKPKVFQS